MADKFCLEAEQVLHEPCDLVLILEWLTRSFHYIGEFPLNADCAKLSL